MRTVYKYYIPASGIINAPENAKPVLFGFQNHKPHVWMELEVTDPETVYTFQVCPTGGIIPDDMEHFQSGQNGPHVWHLYWKTPHA